MSPTTVPVARYSMLAEAQFAVARLEQEGVQAIISGDQTAATFAGLSGMGQQIELRVPADQAKLAIDVLSRLEGEKALDPDWGDDLPEQEGLWICTLCDTPVDIHLDTCPTCSNPREAIKSRAGDLTAQPRANSAAGHIQKPGKVMAESPGELPPELHEELELPATDTFLADELAQRAFRATVMAFFLPILYPYALWLQLRLCWFPGTWSATAARYLYASVVLDGLALLVWLSFVLMLQSTYHSLLGW